MKVSDISKDHVTGEYSFTVYSKHESNIKMVHRMVSK